MGVILKNVVTPRVVAPIFRKLMIIEFFIVLLSGILPNVITPRVVMLNVITALPKPIVKVGPYHDLDGNGLMLAVPG